VHELVGVEVISLLEALVGADLAGLEPPEVLDRERCAVYIDTADARDYLFVPRLQQYRQLFQVQALAISCLRHDLQRSLSLGRFARLQ